MNKAARRRRTLMGAAAFVTAGALSILGISVPAYAAEGDNSEAFAQFLDASLLSAGLASVGAAEASSPSGVDSQTNPLNISALQGLGANLQVSATPSVTVPLITPGPPTPGLLNVGSLGAVQNYAATTPSSAVAASGLITNEGAIAIAENAAPGTGGNATINLTSLLAQLGVSGPTTDILDSLGLQVGAVASRIETSAGGATTATYRVADLKANLHSALVGRLATELRGAGVNLGSSLTTSLNGLAGSGGVLDQALDPVNNINVLGLASVSLGDPTIAVNVANLGTVVDQVLGSNAILVSDDGTVTIDLTAGTITVDLAKIVKPTPPGTGLNGLPANTSVLTGPTLTAVTAGVTNALGKILGPLTTGLNTAVNNSTVTVSVRVVATALPLVGGLTLIDAPIVVSGTLQQIADGTATVDVSRIALLPTVPLCLVPGPFGTCVVSINGLLSGVLGLVTNQVVPALLGALDLNVTNLLTSTSATITSTLDGVVNPVLGALNPLLTDVLANVATVVINEQPPVGADGSHTVSALTVTLLPNLARNPGSNLAKVSLATSTVRALAAPTVDVTQVSIREGNTINVTGAGWDPAEAVTVTYTDVNGNPVGTADEVTPAGDGSITSAQFVPVGTPGPVRATATQGVFTGTDAPFDTVVILGAPVFNVLETAAVPGTSVSLTGANWNPDGGPVTLSFANPDGDLGTGVANVQPDGRFAVAYEVPDVPGPITVTASQGEDELDDSFDVIEPDAPFINIIQTEVTAGQPITYEGTSWEEGTASVVFTDVNGDQIGSSVLVTVDAGGNFVDVAPVVLPYGTLGPVTATATQVAAGNEASDSVNVIPAPAPTVNIVQTTVDKATGEFDIVGDNWGAGTVDIRFYSDGDQVGQLLGWPVDAGSFAVNGVTVPAAALAGTLTATVTQGPRTASDTIEVTVPVVPPVLDIVQESVTAGKQITVTGSGWDPSFVVGLVFVDSSGEQVGQLLTPAPGGAFSVQFTVPTDSALGTLVATADDGVFEIDADVQVVAAPTVTIAEDEILPPGIITVGGENWVDGTPVTLVYTDGDGDEIGTDSVDPTAGVITATFDVVAGTVGPITVSASQTTPGLGTNDATDTVAIVVPPVGPAIDIVEDEVEAGQPIAIEGTGWSAATLVTIAFTDGAGDPLPGSVQVSPLGDGSFDASYIVPLGTIGPVTASATQNGGPAQTDQVVVIPVPVVNIVEDEVLEGEDITIIGNFWEPGEVTITFTNAGGPIGDPITATADGTGRFETSWPVPDGTLGPITATVTQLGATAFDSVAISDAPSVNIVEDEVSEGQVITITGLDWDPATQVTLAFEDGDGNPIAGTQQFFTLGNGAFTRTFEVPLGTVGPVTAFASQNGNDPIADDVIVNARTVVIVEDEVEEGEDITIGGDNWTPNGTVTIVFTDGDDEPIGDPITAPVNPAGHFDAIWPVPTGTVGPITVSVVEEVADPPVSDTVDVTPGAVDADADVAADVDVDVDGVDADVVDADADVDVDGVDADVVDADADLVDADVDGVDVDLVDADADVVDADVDGVDVDLVDADADVVDADVDGVDVDVVDADADLVDADVDGVDVDLVDADADVVDADVDAVDADVVDADADGDADVDAAADAVDVDADVVDADADADAVDADAVDADAVDADAVDADAVDADADVVDADVDAAADAVDVDADVVDADADADVVDADADVVDADVDAAADAVDVDADVVDADVDADVVDADVVDVDVDAAADAVDVDADVVDADADADAVDADADADAVDADADADVVDADVDAAADAVDVDTDVTDADVTDADATDADADATDADADAADADADGTPTPTPTVLPRAVVEYSTVVRGTGVTQKFFGYGFQPGETVAATIYSTPIALTPQVADASGNVVFSVLIGANFELGAHRVEFIGSVSGALPQDREATDFVVTGNPAVLASTGFTGMWLAGLAALLMLAGAGGLGFARKPRPRVN